MCVCVCACESERERGYLIYETLGEKRTQAEREREAIKLVNLIEGWHTYRQLLLSSPNTKVFFSTVHSVYSVCG